MLGMPGLRTFSLVATPENSRVSCGERGVFVKQIRLLDRIDGRWAVRPIDELNDELTVCYRLPVDAASKKRALALVATSLNRGDRAMAAIAAVHMQFPDPPSLKKGIETEDEVARRAGELHRSGLLKFAAWDPAKHPCAGTPPNPGWFAPAGEGAETAQVIPTAMTRFPWEKPQLLEGGEGGGVPRGTLALPFPGGLPRLPRSGEATARSPIPEATAKPWKAPDPSSNLPFMNESEPQLAPYEYGGPTSGILKAGDDPAVELQSGYNGPAKSIPLGTDGFDAYSRAHVEGHAAALMRQSGITEGTLEINNPDICLNCLRNLPTMLPAGSTLHVVLPNGKIIDFQGITP
jgi:SCP1.201-like deaminase